MARQRQQGTGSGELRIEMDRQVGHTRQGEREGWAGKNRGRRRQPQKNRAEETDDRQGQGVGKEGRQVAAHVQ